MHMVWALFYWNTRKSLYRVRGRQGTPPCQNPSDSGEAMKTGCDACAGWHKPSRFRRVCPLLKQNDSGVWLCGVNAADVRPFWGRVFRYVGVVALSCFLFLAALVYGGMHYIGYQVSVRQVIWPPAWHELRGVRADLFIEQARANYAAGRVREAIRSLTIAHELKPSHYEVAMMLAQFHQAGNSGQTDRLYRQQLELHPERRSEIARAWFQSLLARGRMKDIAILAARQLETEPAQSAAWIYALLFATEHGADQDLITKAIGSDKVPAPARQLLEIAVKVSKSDPPGARKLIMETPLIAGFPFDTVYRINKLIELGYQQEAANSIAATRSTLAGRDVAKLIFAVYAKTNNSQRLGLEFGALLDPQRSVSPAECTLMAVHLVNYPDGALLNMVADALPRLPLRPADAWMESALAVFCAAGVLGNAEQMKAVKELIQANYEVTPLGLEALQQFFLGKSEFKRIETILPSLSPLSLELNYALLDRYPVKTPE